MNTSFITKETSIKDILETSPKAAEILIEYGLMCVHCSHAGEHNLKEIKNIYGFSDQDVEEILARINKLAENENKQ